MLVVHAGYLSAALDAEARFHAPVALALVDPYELDKLAAARLAADMLGRPRLIVLVVLNLHQLGRQPADLVLGVGLALSPGVIS